jgi:hypothetical protein
MNINRKKKYVSFLTLTFLLIQFIFLLDTQAKNFDYTVPKKIEAKFEYIKTETEKVAVPEIKQSFYSIYDHYLNIKANLTAENISSLIGELTFFIKKVTSSFKKDQSRNPLLTQLDSLVLHLQYQRDVAAIEHKQKATFQEKNVKRLIEKDFVLRDLPKEDNIQVVTLKQSSNVKKLDRTITRPKFNFADSEVVDLKKYHLEKSKKDRYSQQNTYTRSFNQLMFYLRKQNPLGLMTAVVAFTLFAVIGLSFICYIGLRKIFSPKQTEITNSGTYQSASLDLYPVFHFNKSGELTAANQKAFALTQTYLQLKHISLSEVHKVFSAIILNLNTNAQNSAQSYVIINDEKYFIQKESKQNYSLVGFIPYREIRDDRFDYFNMKEIPRDVKNIVNEEVWKSAQNSKMTDLGHHLSKTLMGLSMVFKMKNILVDLDFNGSKDQKIFCPLSHHEIDAIFVPFLIGMGQVMEKQKQIEIKNNNQKVIHSHHEINIGLDQRDQRLYINFHLAGMDLNQSVFNESIIIGKKQKTSFTQILSDIENINKKVGLRVSLFNSTLKKSLHVNQSGTNIVLTLDLRTFQDIQSKKAQMENVVSSHQYQSASVFAKEDLPQENRRFSQRDFRS